MRKPIQLCMRVSVYIENFTQNDTFKSIFFFIIVSTFNDKPLDKK